MMLIAAAMKMTVTVSHFKVTKEGLTFYSLLPAETLLSMPPVYRSTQFDSH